MRYLQINQDNVITDCIDYPYSNYIEFDGEVPQAVYGGWYKLENGVIVEYLELKPMDKEDEVETLKTNVSSMNKTIMGLMTASMPPM